MSEDNQRLRLSDRRAGPRILRRCIELGRRYRTLRQGERAGESDRQSPARRATDAAYVSSVIDQIPGPVLAVGHSYGGAVITNAASSAKNVVGLVYVAGFAPDEGEPVADIVGASKDSILLTAVPETKYPTGQGSETASEYSIDPEKFHEVFSADLSQAESDVLAASQRPSAAATLTRRPAHRPGSG